MNHNNNTIRQTKWDAKRVRDKHRQEERISNLWRHSLHVLFVITKNHKITKRQSTFYQIPWMFTMTGLILVMLLIKS
ncbi:Protein of unknown function [Cotesia congregata]|uniref:Uncharacterized protein n=1 Tax=Cotesia congregata TaxID=51543 RepID=A0A8J2HLL6_COTCN|nr:Protein of unknown function [Cotesia congregata]